MLLLYLVEVKKSSVTNDSCVDMLDSFGFPTRTFSIALDTLTSTRVVVVNISQTWLVTKLPIVLRSEKFRYYVQVQCKDGKEK